MAMSYDTSLVAGGEIVLLTGVTDLANLETDNELRLDSFTLNAHREVYRRLESAGIDPTKLTNETRLRAAVAWAAARNLALAGHLDPERAQDYLDKFEEELRYYRPATTENRAGRMVPEATPHVANFEDGWESARGSPSGITTQRWTSSRPRRR